MTAIEPPSPSPELSGVAGAAMVDQAFDRHDLLTLRDMEARHAVAFGAAPDLVQRLIAWTGRPTVGTRRREPTESGAVVSGCACHQLAGRNSHGA